eukprot:scaffold132155_cov28-Tisochrysis_lutea.AAC.1
MSTDRVDPQNSLVLSHWPWQVQQQNVKRARARTHTHARTLAIRASLVVCLLPCVCIQGPCAYREGDLS